MTARMDMLGVLCLLIVAAFWVVLSRPFDARPEHRRPRPMARLGTALLWIVIIAGLIWLSNFLIEEYQAGFIKLLWSR